MFFDLVVRIYIICIYSVNENVQTPLRAFIKLESYFFKNVPPIFFSKHTHNDFVYYRFILLRESLFILIHVVFVELGFEFLEFVTQKTTGPKIPIYNKI